MCRFKKITIKISPGGGRGVSSYFKNSILFGCLLNIVNISAYADEIIIKDRFFLPDEEAHKVMNSNGLRTGILEIKGQLHSSPCRMDRNELHITDSTNKLSVGLTGCGFGQNGIKTPVKSKDKIIPVKVDILANGRKSSLHSLSLKLHDGKNTLPIPVLHNSIKTWEAERELLTIFMSYE